jgi:hypothetical protein
MPPANHQPRNPFRQLLAAAVLALSAGLATAQPIRLPPGPPAPADEEHVSAVLLTKVENNFPRWFERVSGEGDNAQYVQGDEDERRRRRIGWDQVAPLVTQVQEFEVTLPGQLFVIAQFTMEDKPEYKLKERLHSVGGLYPAVLERAAWKDLGIGNAGFHITEKWGGNQRPVRQFSYRGDAGDKQIRVTGNGLAVKPGKYRLRVMAAMAKDWSAWFPADAKVYVYFAPELPNPPKDSDSDGLSDEEERKLGTDPRQADTDGGGVNDGDEVRAGTDPKNPRDDKQPPATELVIGSVTATPGGTASVPVMLRNANKLGDLNVTIEYLGNILELSGVEKGALIERGVQFTASKADPGPIFGNGNWRVGIAVAARTGLAGSGELAVLKFKVTGKTGERARISAKVTSANRVDDTAVKIRTTDGILTVGGIIGDGDGDGRITSRDALMALQLSARPGSPPEDATLDIDSDGKITAKDARWLLQMAVGNKPAGFTGELPPFGLGDDGDAPPLPVPPPHGPQRD